MNKIKTTLLIAMGAVRNRNWQLVVMMVVMMLFVLAAGAPNATIGIGK